MFNRFKTLLWDFDGVILDSVPIRDKGYRYVLEDIKNYPDDKVDRLIEFQQKNGGLSRYVKFRYFYEEILGESITENEVRKFAGLFSEYMLENLMDPDLLIDETLNFIRSNYQKFNMHIVSGSDQDELRHICSELEIDSFFKSIHGSPTPKIELVESIIKENHYDTDDMVLIGDSINDYDAARINGITFFGYNNPEIRKKGSGYITSF